MVTRPTLRTNLSCGIDYRWTLRWARHGGAYVAATSSRERRKRPGRRTPPPRFRGGRLLRDRLIMRLLATERMFRALGLVLLAIGVFKLRSSKGRVEDAFENELPLIRPLARQLGWNIDDSKLVHHIEQAFSLSATTLTWIAVGLLVYAGLQVIEAVGLWMVKRWGEYFAVVATSLFLPLEIYELTEKITWLRAGLLLVNIAAVVWLIWSKRLFGVRGGGAAYHAEHSEESLLTVERAAVKQAS